MDIDRRLDVLEERMRNSENKDTALSAQMNAMGDTLHLQMSHIKELLEKSIVPIVEEIKTQAIKTNGRVTKLEDDSGNTRIHIASCKLPEVTDRIKKLESRQDKLESATETSRVLFNNPFILKAFMVGTTAISLGILVFLILN